MDCAIDCIDEPHSREFRVHRRNVEIRVDADLARSFVYHGRYQTVEELLQHFDRLTVDDVMSQTGWILEPERYTLVAYGPARLPALKVLPWAEVQEC